jgi:hypothetical protein
LFAFAKRLQEKIPKIEKLFWVRDMVNMVYISRKLRTTENSVTTKAVSLSYEITGRKVTTTKELRSSIGEDGFGSSETKYGRRQCQNQRLIAGGGLQKQGHNPAKLLWVQILIIIVL